MVKKNRNKPEQKKRMKNIIVELQQKSMDF